jgi:nitrilase
MDAAISLDGPELAVLRDACAEHDIWAFVGVCERGTRAGRGSVYCTVAVLDSRGKLAGAHRKLVPTHDERLVWAFGDGAGLCCYDIAGARVGALLCWENWMPQARLALYADGADVHLSLWPGSAALTHQITRFIALEGRVWSIAAGGVLSLADVPPGFPLAEQLLAYGEELPFDGGSCVADPSGRWVHEPLVCKEELLIIDCARETVRRERLLFDPAGHYSRPDVFTTSIDRRRRLPVEFEDDR